MQDLLITSRGLAVLLCPNNIFRLMSASEEPRALIPELCKQFYHLGWVTGTGGGMSIRKGYVDILAKACLKTSRYR